MFVALNHRLFLRDGRQQVHRRDGARDVQQRARRRVGVRRTVILRQPARECRQRTRHAVGTGVARVLPAEPRSVSRVDAGLHLRAGSQRRDLRQPLCLQRRDSRSATQAMPLPSRAGCHGAASRRSGVRKRVATPRSSSGSPAGRETASHRAPVTNSKLKKFQTDRKTSPLSRSTAAPSALCRMRWVTSRSIENGGRVTASSWNCLSKSGRSPLTTG